MLEQSTLFQHLPFGEKPKSHLWLVIVISLIPLAEYFGLSLAMLACSLGFLIHIQEWI